MSRRYRFARVLASVLVLGGSVACERMSSAEPEPAKSATPPLAKSTNAARAASRAEAQRFLDYNRSIQLTPEQEAIRREALEAIPAPCCSDRTAATCCCECNMARTIWGLSKHLIADEDRSAEEVREAAEGWIRTINPAGHAGDACYRGRCGHAFERDGCGGMREAKLVF